MSEFYFDSINATDPTMGTVTAGAFSESTTTITPHHLTDDNIFTYTNFISTGEKGVRLYKELRSDNYWERITDDWDAITEYWNLFAKATAATYFGIYTSKVYNAGFVELYGSVSAATGYVLLDTFYIEEEGWKISNIGDQSYKYYVVQFSGSYDIDIGSIIIGGIYTTPIRYELGNVFSTIPQNDFLNSYNGYEYSNKNAPIKEEIDFTFWNISTQEKVKVEQFIEDASERNFLYREDSVDKVVHFKKKPTFTEIASGYWSVHFNIAEQAGEGILIRDYADWTYDTIPELYNDMEKIVDEIVARIDQPYSEITDTYDAVLTLYEDWGDV